MKKIILLFSLFLSIFVFESSVSASTNDTKQIMMGYYRVWRDVTVSSDNKSSMLDLPGGLDIISVFPDAETDDTKFFETLGDKYVPTLHKRGTRVIRTINIDVLKNIPDEFIHDGNVDYNAFADHIIAKYITPWNLDGLDIDNEGGFGTIDELTDAIETTKSLSEKIGPQSGTDKLFIVDTTGAMDGFVQSLSGKLSYVFLQAYGKNTIQLDQLWATYKNEFTSNQFAVGVSFPEENGYNWHDTDSPFETSRAVQYANWNPKEGNKGGMFAYAIDRDGKDFNDNTISKSNYDWTKYLMNILHFQAS